MSGTANLQTGLTVKQAAKAMNVSERSVYMAMKIVRLRPDLEPLIAAGKLTLHKALKIAEGKDQEAKPTSYDRLLKAWNAATDEDRERLVLAAMGRNDGEVQE